MKKTSWLKISNNEKRKLSLKFHTIFGRYKSNNQKAFGSKEKGNMVNTTLSIE